MIFGALQLCEHSRGPSRGRSWWRLRCRAVLAAVEVQGCRHSLRDPLGQERGHCRNIPDSMGLHVAGKQSSTALYKSISEWNSFSLGRGVRRALPPGNRSSSRGPFSPGGAEAHRQPNHRLCDSKPEPFSVSCFLTGVAGGAEIRKLRN